MVFVEYSSEAAFVLWDEDREFLTDPVAVSTTETMPEVTEHVSDHSSEESDNEPEDIEALCQTAANNNTERGMHCKCNYRKLQKYLNRRK